MALNWNISKCKDFKELSTDKNWPITNTLIWGTMIVGMSEITQDNAKEFYARLHLVELMSGNMITRDSEAYSITLEDIERRIGLRTNVTTMSRPAFIKVKVGAYFKEIVEA